MGALTLWLGIESLVEFFVMPFAGKLFTTKRINLFIALAALLVAGGTLGFSLCTEFWQFVICGALIGCGMPFLFGLPQTTLIGNWFGEKHQGRMLSIATVSYTHLDVYKRKARLRRSSGRWCF